MKKLNEFGYTKFELLVVVLLLGIVAFITINHTSYAFAPDKASNVKEIKKLVELQAEDYADEHLELFNETNTTFLTVGFLVEKKYLVGNEQGLFIDPIDSNKNYNDDKIKLEYNKDTKEVKATYVD